MKGIILMPLLLIGIVSSSKMESKLVLAESFEEFFNRFCQDSTFQYARIKFPLKGTLLNTDYKEVEALMSMNDWNYRQFYFSKSFYCIENVVPIIYDNFTLTESSSPERVIKWHSVSVDIYELYYFKLYKEKWFLVEMKDFSL